MVAITALPIIAQLLDAKCVRKTMKKIRKAVKGMVDKVLGNVKKFAAAIVRLMWTR